MTRALTSPQELVYPIHRLSVTDYHRMIEIGIFGEEDRVELLDGILIEMAAIGRFHATCVRKINTFFVRHLGDRYTCSQEQPVTISDGSEPEPDFVIAEYRADSYLDGHPTPEDIHLLIEVADRTLDRDRGPKASLYARAGIREYWIVNLVDRSLQICTQPDEEAGSYENIRTLEEGDTLSHPLTGEVALLDFLP